MCVAFLCIFHASALAQRQNLSQNGYAKIFPIVNKAKYVGADGCRHVHGMQYLFTVPTVPMAGHLQLIAYQWLDIDV
jgi:hypothetical protein